MSDKGRKVALAALADLLRRAERAWARQADKEKSLSLRFSEASFPDYHRLPMWQDKVVAHAELRNAQRDGAIVIEWERRAGEDGQIERIVLADADVVARILGVTPAWAAYDLAASQLEPLAWHDWVPEILARWRAGKQVRGMGPTRVQDVIDACRVIRECKDHARQSDDDVLIRRLSTGLFEDSKRIEALFPALDALTSESLDAPWRDVDDVLSGLGLIKVPQPVLLGGGRGAGTVELTDGTRLPIAYPYIGLAPGSIKRIDLPESVPYVLTVENLTTFYEMVRARLNGPAGLILYTAGMPSPALLRVYGLCLEQSLANERPRMHWGDIDLGGFRIASHLARAHPSPLTLWEMDPSQLDDAPARKMLSGDEIREITRIASWHGWEEIAARIADDKRAIEQEALEVYAPEYGRPRPF